MFGQLRTKLTVVYLGLFAFVLLALLLVMSRGVESHAERIVRQELGTSATVFERIWRMHADELQGAASVLSKDFGFRSAAALNDDATLVSALDNLKLRLRIPVAFFIANDGHVVGIADPRARADAAKLWTPLDDGRQRGVIALAGTAYSAVATPVLTPMPTGWVIFATPLDAREMQALTRLSAIPLSARVSFGGDVPASLVAQTGSATPIEIDEHGDRVLYLASPLERLDTGTQPILVLRYSLTAALKEYAGLRYMIFAIAVIGLIALAIGSWRLAKSITRPIMALDAATRSFRRGDHVQVAVSGRDEIGRLATSFNEMVSAIEEREAKIAHMAYHDPLTGLPNRLQFRQQLDLAMRKPARRHGALGVICLDLDNFKFVNDTLGHPIGDKLLREVARRFAAAAQDVVIARLGGDEFAILIEPERRAISPEHLARAMVAAVEAPFIVDGHQIAIGTSAGIALAPQDGADADTLLKNADLALYRAKQDGRGTFRFFEPLMDAAAQARRAMEMDLREALGRGELELYFQPLFDLARNEISAFEALLRWHHPKRGTISPLDFIPLAEETGLIIPIGEWIIHQACRTAQAWPGSVRVAVNVSAVQFRNPGLGGVVIQALAASGLEPARLELEITESVFIDSAESTLGMLHSLREIGVRIALDDFGTGYSSLSYLRSFPFDKLKIDRSFIVDLLAKDGAIAIVRAITDLAQALGMETTAEGVEDVEQVEALKLQGCSHVQGFLFSRPVPNAQVVALLERHNGELGQKAA